MRSNDAAIWLGMAGVLLYIWARGRETTSATVVPSMPWTLTGFDFLPPPPGLKVANQVAQPPFQGGLRRPSTLSDDYKNTTVAVGQLGFPIMSGY